MGERPAQGQGKEKLSIHSTRLIFSLLQLILSFPSQSRKRIQNLLSVDERKLKRAKTKLVSQSKILLDTDFVLRSVEKPGHRQHLSAGRM